MAVIDVLVVAGGGGGGGSGATWGIGAGGGGGGVVEQTGRSISSGTGYTVTIGNGGAGGGAGFNAGTAGQNSVFDTITALGGGGGGTFSVNGTTGGSGGGGGESQTGFAATQGNSGGGTGFGFAGGNGAVYDSGGANSMGGGGGAGGVGSNGTAPAGTGGNGGPGRTNSFSGSAQVYGSGGGGAKGASGTGGVGGTNAGSSGAGGGGNGTNATANFGGGGGAGNGAGNQSGGNGGSGVVIIRALLGVIQSATGGTHTTDATYDIWTFTASGTWTPTVSLPPVTFTVSDSTAVSDSARATQVLEVVVSDSTAVTDTPDIKEHRLINVSDSSAVTDTPIINERYFFSVSDSSTVSDTVVIVKVYNFAVTDSTAISEFLHIEEHTFASSDETGSVMVSDYKWLTPTLKTAQLGPGYSPYFSLKIVDDTLAPNAILTDPAVPILGKAVNAPDGSILMAGGDGAGNLKFWKVTDASAAFPAGTTLATTSAGSNFRTDLNTSIAVSDWINGTYVIDIFYFANSGAYTLIMQKRSVDGGTTWSSPFAINNPGILVGASQNYSVAAGVPVYDPASRFVRSLFFYIKPTSTAGYDQIHYQICRGGTAYEADTIWSRMVDSQDWTIQSIDSTYDGTYDYIVFAGHHNWYDNLREGNLSIYSTRLDRITSNQTTDCWQLVREVLVANSSSVLNFNTFTFPQLSFDGEFFYVVFSAIITTDLTTSQIGVDQSSPLIQYFTFIAKSTNMKNFTYPNPILDPTGAETFTDTAGVSLVPQTGTAYYYLLGNGQNWQFIKNDVTADITNDIIEYEVQEMAGGSFQISVTLGNANNKWVGTSPTGTGAAAIAANKKIFLEQGYKSTAGGNEAVPRNVFYIDTVQQKTSANNNVAVITGRDASRYLQILTSKFTFTNDGPQFYTDLFDGSTSSIWEVVAGIWQQTLLGVGSGYSFKATVPADEPAAVLPSENSNTESALVFCLGLLPFQGGSENTFVVVYPIYYDDSNYVRIKIYSDYVGLNIKAVMEVVVNGSLNSSSTVVIAGELREKMLPIYIRKYNYHTYDILLGAYAAGGIYGRYLNTTLDAASSPTPVALFTGFQSDLYFSASHAVATGNPGLGCYGLGEPGIFQFFKFLRFGDSLSVQEAAEYIGTLSGITDYNPKYDFKDTDYLASNYSASAGSYSVSGGRMLLAPSSLIYNVPNPIANGEMEFDAKVTGVSGTTGIGLQFVFRASSDKLSYYYFELINTAGDVVAYLKQVVSGDATSPHVLATSSMTDYGTTTNPIPIDITALHNYRIVLVDQIFQLFIDGRMYLMWHDNNVTASSLNWLGSGTAGQWGVKSNSASNVYIGNFKSLNMFKQTPNVTINPGDDLTSVMTRVVSTAYGWSYTDLLGRYIIQNLDSNDASSFTYEDQIYNLQADTANQQFINEVVVTGQGVMATYQNSVLIAQMGEIRSMSITDYTITTYEDAYLRAQKEMINANRFNNQNTPSHPMNVGAEVFDVVTIINTGNNSTGVSGNFRVYNENFINGGSSGQYSVEIETGTLS